MHHIVQGFISILKNGKKQIDDKFWMILFKTGMTHPSIKPEFKLLEVNEEGYMFAVYFDGDNISIKDVMDYLNYLVESVNKFGLRTGFSSIRATGTDERLQSWILEIRDRGDGTDFPLLVSSWTTVRAEPPTSEQTQAQTSVQSSVVATAVKRAKSNKLLARKPKV